MLRARRYFLDSESRVVNSQAKLDADLEDLPQGVDGIVVASGGL
jgi:hypothetical protein